MCVNFQPSLTDRLMPYAISECVSSNSIQCSMHEDDILSRNICVWYYHYRFFSTNKLKQIQIYNFVDTEDVSNYLRIFIREKIHTIIYWYQLMFSARDSKCKMCRNWDTKLILKLLITYCVEMKSAALPPSLRRVIPAPKLMIATQAGCNSE